MKGWLGIILVIFAAGFYALIDQLMIIALHDTNFISGWLLLALIIFLTLFNLHKKLPFLPLGSTHGWLLFHIYGGLLSLPMFLIHIRLRFPEGGLEQLLIGLFSAVVVSGLIGYWLTVYLPKKLTLRRNNELFERIPLRLRQLSEDVEQLILQSVEEVNSKLLPDFYQARLIRYFARPRHFFQHVWNLEKTHILLLDEIDGLHRYANAQEQEILRSLTKKVLEKSRLDYQHALQLLLKSWLFVHIPLTYSLLLTTGLHIFISYEFRGY